MKDVAAAAGVSLGTVSRVVNKHPSVKANSRIRVHEAMKNLGFAPNFVAQSMRNRSTKTIGCIVPSIVASFHARALQAAEAELYEHGYTTMLTNTRGIPLRDMEAFRLLQGRRVDGVIAIFSESDEMLRLHLSDETMPIVMIDRRLPGIASSVVSDYASGTAQAVRLLIAMGHRRIALLIENESTLFSVESRNAYLETHRDLSVPVDQALILHVELSKELAFEKSLALLTSADRPTAVIAGAYAMGGVLRAIGATSLSIPVDISVVSLGESDVTELYEPSLTSVRLNSDGVGRAATRLLLKNLKGVRPNAAEIILPVELVLRRSCASAPAST